MIAEAAEPYTHQTPVVHGDACPKDGSVAVEEQRGVRPHHHLGIQQRDPAPTVLKEEGGASKDGGEAKCCNGAGVLRGLQRGVVLKGTVKW